MNANRLYTYRFIHGATFRRKEMIVMGGEEKVAEAVAWALLTDQERTATGRFERTEWRVTSITIRPVFAVAP